MGTRFKRLRLDKGVYAFTFLLAILALFLSIATLFLFYPKDPPVRDQTYDTFHLLNSITEKLLDQITAVHNSTSSPNVPPELKDTRLKHAAFLTEILALVGSIKLSLPEKEEERTVRSNQSQGEETAELFLTEEIRKYIRMKPNRLGKQNFMGANGTFTSVGQGCLSMREELEEYMDYDVGDFCKDDWKQAQRLMVHGCDPLPRRRCFARAPKLYAEPLPANESIWKLPDDRNVRWSGYRCKSFACLAEQGTGKGFFKCYDCFNLTHHEWPRWVRSKGYMNQSSEFLIEEVLGIKPGGIRIGLDFSVGTGTFAARMREFNVTVISAMINLGAPFNEMIALRGLLPLYLTLNQRLPFFDNTLDMIHSTRFLDGWIDFVMLDFVLYDWDRVLRPGGLLWIDSFFCRKRDLEDYLDGFRMLRYKEHKWVVEPKLDKEGEEVFFSAVLEKPPRPF